jgi:hypothetical protein
MEQLMQKLPRMLAMPVLTTLSSLRPAAANTFLAPSLSTWTRLYVYSRVFKVGEGDMTTNLCLKPIDEIRTGDYRSLFHPEMLISGKEDAANNCTSDIDGSY